MVVLQLQSCKHEPQEMLPIIEAQILFQRKDMLEEDIDPRECASLHGASFVQHLQHRVKQQGEDIQRHLAALKNSPTFPSVMGWLVMKAVRQVILPLTFAIMNST